MDDILPIVMLEFSPKWIYLLAVVSKLALRPPYVDEAEENPSVSLNQPER